MTSSLPLRFPRQFAGYTLVLGLLAVAACGDDNMATTSATGGAGSTSATGGMQASTTASSSSSQSQAVVVGTGSGGNMGQGGAGGGCLTEESEAPSKPLVLFVVLDRSASMQGALWTGMVGALTDYFTNPGATAISAGLTYFPPAGATEQCATSSYNPPTVVPVPLDTDAAILVTDLGNQTPGGDFTPTWAALYGTLQYATAYQDANPNTKTAVVFASDGDPTACNSDIGDIANIAATGFLYNGVQTFAVAINGATVANLDQIAQAGGTSQAFDVTMDVTQFSQKMDEIRKEALGCDYDIPDPSQGTFDPTKLNVNVDPGNGNPIDTIPNVADSAACAAGPGWYYDDPAAPTQVILCPASCDGVSTNVDAKVSLVFGCPTMTGPN